MKKILIAIIIITFIIMPKNQQIKYPLDEASKEIIRQVAQEVVEDGSFKSAVNSIRFNTFFESIDGYSITESTQGNVSIDGNSLQLTTDATSGDVSSISKTPSWQSVLTFASRSMFRTTVIINDGGGSIENQVSNIVVGDLDNGSHYGFRIGNPDGSATSEENKTIYGITHDGTSQNIVDLGFTVSSSDSVNLEAKYIPNSAVLFLIDGVERDSSKANIPSSTLEVNGNLFEIKIETEENTAKTIQTSFFDYIQKKFEI